MQNIQNIQNYIQIYYYIAIFATIVFIIKMAIFSLVGGDTEVNVDFNTETDTDCSFNFLSIQSILAFMMGFGWMGYAGLSQYRFGAVQNILIAVGVGILFSLLNTGLMFCIKKLEKTIVKDKNMALNKVGKAYTYFEPKGQGQIEININDQLSVVNATNNTDENINAFDLIKVVKVENDIMYIEKQH